MLAYGVELKADIDLSPYLVEGGAASHALDIVRACTRVPPVGLDRVTPLHSSHGRSLSLRSDADFDGVRKGQGWQLEVAGIASFFWLTGYPVVRYCPDGSATDEQLAFWMLHSLVPLVLSLEGRFDFLHAGAVESEWGSLVFVAPSMGGKSTLTAYFVDGGHALVSDDKLGTFVDEDGCFVAVPAHTRQRAYRAAEDLGRAAAVYAVAPGPIAALFELDRVSPDARVAVREIQGFRKFECLAPHYLFGFPHLEARRLRYLAGLLDRIPFFRVEIPGDLDRLGEVHAAIMRAGRGARADCRFAGNLST